ncbi:MAG: hypothetical protein J5I59_11685 [Saprospiraceae bacterium]|nr:hypothetical protein [Saprospiraceae bacterium]
MIVPLGAKARLSFSLDSSIVYQGLYTLRLIDISGAQWESTVSME